MNRSRLALAGGVAAVAAVAFAVLLLTGSEEPDKRATVVSAAKAAGAELVDYDWSYGINRHTDGRVQYPTNPPTNGPHARTWARDGSYAGNEPPPTEQIIHAQEHGRVVIQYRQGLPKSEVAKLQRLFDEDSDHVLLLENRTKMPCPVAATAWGHAILCRGTDAKSLDALRAFRDAYRDTAPETFPGPA